MPTLKSLRGLPLAIRSQLEPIAGKSKPGAYRVPHELVKWLKTEGNTVHVVLAIPLISEANDSGSKTWRIRQHRAKEQREAVSLALGFLKGRGEPKQIHAVRLAARMLDPNGNLQTAFKHVFDELSEICGFDDRSSGVLWTFDQKKAWGDLTSGCELWISWDEPKRCLCCQQALPINKP